jgi:hypothetical protein
LSHVSNTRTIMQFTINSHCFCSLYFYFYSITIFACVEFFSLSFSHSLGSISKFLENIALFCFFLIPGVDTRFSFTLFILFHALHTLHTLYALFKLFYLWRKSGTKLHFNNVVLLNTSSTVYKTCKNILVLSGFELVYWSVIFLNLSF